MTNMGSPGFQITIWISIHSQNSLKISSYIPVIDINLYWQSSFAKIPEIYYDYNP